MSIITESGLNAFLFRNTRSAMEAKYKAKLGSEMRTEPQSVGGQIVDFTTEAVDKIEAELAHLYAALDVDQAHGILLDNLGSLSRKSRFPATLPEVTIDIATGISPIAIDQSFTISAIDGHEFRPKAAFALLGNTVNSVVFVSDEVTDKIFTPNTINNIVTPLNDVLTVTNPLSSSAGIDKETDTHFRARLKTTPLSPISTTLTGMEDGLLDIAGITDMRLFYNNTAATDADGILPHSILPVMEGGADADIIEKLITQLVSADTGYNTSIVPANSLTFVTGSYVSPTTGQSFSATFARPIRIDLYVKIELAPTPFLPVNFADQIEANIEDLLALKLIGHDLYATELHHKIGLVTAARATLIQLSPDGVTWGDYFAVNKFQKITAVSYDITVV